MPFSSLTEECEGWETTARETHFHSAHLEVATEEVRTPARPDGRSWIVAHRKAAVIVAPLTADGRLVLIRQERIPIRSAIWEVPSGQIDDAAALDARAIEAVALRELQEETGYQLAPGAELLPLGHFFSSPGFTDERGYHFLARPVELSAAGQAHEESETILDCRAFTTEEISRMIRENEIRDANTLSICAKLVARGEFLLHI
ncbi:NUDIX hydrolase [soil metagenome]|nr:NUDIX hydrolase [Chthoniobacterales bacterium]